MVEVKSDLPKLEQSIHHHRIAVFSIIAFLIVLTIAIIVLSKSLIPQSSTIPTQSTSKKEPDVLMKTEYENPFAKNAQYVNPFSQYKNPFDRLK